MRAFTASLLSVAFLAPGISFAQQEGEPETIDTNIPAVTVFGSEVVPQPEGLTSCFDHYQFGSTPVVITGESSEVAAGAVLEFSGTIGNANRYAIPDAALYAKVMRARPAEKDQNGPDVVDWLTVAKGLTLPAGGSVPFAGSWQVPPDATNGDYQVVSFVVASERFQFAGLPFTDDVVGPGYRFMVVGGNDEPAGFRKDGVTIGGDSYAFAAFPPRIKEDANLEVRAVVGNDRAMPLRGTLTWQLYSWDQVMPSHLLDEKKEEVEVHPGSTAEVGYLVTDKEHSVYYLVGTLTTPEGAKSIIGVRAVRDGINTPRIHFVGADPEAGGGATAVACLHSTGYEATEDARLELTVTRTGFWGSLENLTGPLAHATYQGRVPGEIYALTTPFASEEGVLLTAALYEGGALIDTVSVPYCDGACEADANPAVMIAFGVFIVVFVLTLLVLIIRRALRRPPPTTRAPYI